VNRLGAIGWARGLAVAGPLVLGLALAAPAAALEQRLTAADGAAGDELGWSVAVAGDTAVVGAPGADVGANANQGAVYVFARAGDAWTQTAKLTASDGAASDQLGFSVAVAGDTIVAGAPFAAIGANADQGAAYSFAATGAAARTETAKLTASDGAAGDLFGWSVALAGDTIVAGAPRAAVGANADQGAALVFFSPAPPPPPGPPPAPPPPPGPPPAPPPPPAGPAIAGLKLGSRCVRPTRSGRVRVRMSLRLARPGPVQVRIDRGVGTKARRSCPKPNPERRFTGRFRRVATLRRVPTQPAAAAAAVGRRLTLDLRLAPGLYRITVRAILDGNRLSRPVRRYLRVLGR
jgi:hypothetical protein